MLGLFVGLRAFKNNGVIEEGRAPEVTTEVRATGEARAELERQARIILDMAKELDKAGKTNLALDQLDKLTKNYVGTAAAREANYALDRRKRDQTLFGEDASPALLGGPTPPPPGSGTAPGPAPPRTSVASNANPAAPKAAGTAPSPGSVAPPLPATKPLPPGYRPRFEHPIHTSGWPTRISCDRDGAEMVLVPADTFIMGRNDGEPEERPTHEVFVSTYYIDLHEVTVGQYLRFLKETGRSIEPAKLVPGGTPVADDLPVVNVTYKQAKDYSSGRSVACLPRPSGNWRPGGRRGGSRTGTSSSPRKDPEKGDRPMEPVMSLSTDLTPYGAFDMAANAWEWTLDYYDSRYYRQFRNLVRDPKGPNEPLARIVYATVRGGSKNGILTWRGGLRTESKQPYLGFRGALPAEGPINPVAAPPPQNPTIGPAMNGGVQPF